MVILAVMSSGFAVDFNDSISEDEKDKFDKILTPVMKIYDFVKYTATVLAVLFLMFAGFTFITAGHDQRKRESAKTMAMYVVIGLMVIWMAPLVVDYISA